MAAPLFMLDTNIVSDAIMRPSGSAARSLADLLPGQAVISVVVEGELRFGIARASATVLERRVDALLHHVATLGLDDQVARLYGTVRADLTRQGTPIGMNDLWIAAHALQLGLILVTDNEGEFRRVPGLTVENWLRDGPRHTSRWAAGHQVDLRGQHPPVVDTGRRRQGR